MKRAFALAILIVLTVLSIGAQAQPASTYSLVDVIGQQTLGDTSFNAIERYRGMHIGAVHVHDYLNGDKALYVYDSANSRILGFLNPDWTSPLEQPDIVLGQDDSYVTGTCNGNNNDISVLPGARSLCLHRGAHTISREEEGRRTSMDSGLDGSLFVIDQYNNRVLMFNDPFGTTAGAGDSTADAVWGQSGFNAKTCNRGAGQPTSWNLTASSLCTTNTVSNSIDPYYVTSLDIDRWGNMWVTDIINHRVLRFPYDAGTGLPAAAADIVLGQPNFTGKTYQHDACNLQPPGVAFCQLYAIKVNEATGEIFVAHYHVYTPIAMVTVFKPNTWETNPTGYTYAREIGRGQLAYPGFIHFLDANRFLIEDKAGDDVLRLYTTTGTLVRTINQSNIVGTTPDSSVRLESIHGQYIISGGKLFIPEQVAHNSVLVFDMSQFETHNRLIYEGELLGGANYTWNVVNGLGLGSPNGMTVSQSHNQLFVSDRFRVLVWNLAPGRSYAGRPADFVIGQSTFSTNQPTTSPIFGSKVGGLSVDEAGGKLWVARERSVYAFNLPITANTSTPLIELRARIGTSIYTGNLPVRGQPANYDFRVMSVAFNPDDGALWMVDLYHSRLARVENPYTAPEVTMIFGQANINGMSCNRGVYSVPTAKTLCFSNMATFDAYGNLYIAEGVYEGRNDMPGNKRVLAFDKATLDAAAATGLVFPQPSADRVYSVRNFTTSPMSSFTCVADSPCNPIGVTFDQNDRMVVLSDAYFNAQNQRIYVYNQPRRSTGYVAFNTTLDTRLPYAMGQGGHPAITPFEQLLLQDHTWNRVLVINNRVEPQVVLNKSAIAVSEEGATATYTLRLIRKPVAPVTIAFMYSDDDQLEANPASVTFSPLNWDQAQTVTISAVNDALIEGTHSVTISHAITSTDTEYDGFEIGTVQATITETTPELIASETALTVSEEGDTDSYSVVLTRKPASDVTVSVAFGQDDQLTGSPQTLTFTPGNYNLAQTVTIAAVNDAIIEGTHHVDVLHVLTSADPNYDGLETDPIDVTITETTPDVVVSKIALTVSEEGATDAYTVVLTREPAADVTVTVTYDYDDQLTSSPQTLTFTPENYTSAQTFTIAAVNDALVEGTHHVGIYHEVASDDLNYHGLVIDNIDVTITETTPDVILSETELTVSEEGGTDTYTIALTRKPASDVTVSVVFAEEDQLTATPLTLTFTPENYSSAQIVTIAAVNDAEEEGAHNVAIFHELTSADLNYEALETDSIDVTINETTPDVILSKTALTVSEEGDTDSYSVVLTRKPASDVTVSVVFAEEDQLTAAPLTLTFTPETYSSAQTVTIAAVNDAEEEGAHNVAIFHELTSADLNYEALETDSIDVTINETTPDVILSKIALTVSEEGGTDSYTVALTRKPASDVTVTLAFSPENQLTAAPLTLTFTPETYSSAQTVTIAAVNDALAEGTHNVSVVHTLASADLNYNAFAADWVSVTITDNDTSYTELVTNGSFESGTAGWQFTAPTGDKVLCKPSKARTGSCVLKMNGSPSEAFILLQNIDLSGVTLAEGDVLTLTGYFKGGGTTSKAKFELLVTYAGQPKLKIKKNVRQNIGYIQAAVPVHIVGSGALTGIKVRLKHLSSSGTMWLDDVSLTLAHVPPRDILGMPLPPDDMRGQN